jgi:hypothetical protein
MPTPSGRPPCSPTSSPHGCRRTRRHLADAVRILDATRVELSSLSGGWVDVVNGARAIKLHIAYDRQADTPHVLAVTGQNVNDITPAKAMPIEPGMTYGFDLAYYDFAWWAELDAKGCRVVSRLKTNTPLEVTAELAVPKGSSILSDRIGLVPRRLARSRQNPRAARSARSPCASMPTRRSASSPTTSTPRPRTSPRSINSAGRSSCSSNGSSST